MICVRCLGPRKPERDRSKIPKSGRALCSYCYQWAKYHGVLWDYPRITMSRNDLLDDYTILRSEGYTWKQCAVKLHMKYGTFERAMFRARRAGDPRALRIGEQCLPNQEGMSS